LAATWAAGFGNGFGSVADGLVVYDFGIDHGSVIAGGFGDDFGFGVAGSVVCSVGGVGGCYDVIVGNVIAGGFGVECI
jgi:hypothetical protein